MAAKKKRSTKKQSAKKRAAPKKRTTSKARSRGAAKGGLTKARNRAKEKRAIWLQGRIQSQKKPAKERKQVVYSQSYPVENWADIQEAKQPFIASGKTIGAALGVLGLIGVGTLAYEKIKDDK